MPLDCVEIWSGPVVYTVGSSFRGSEQPNHPATRWLIQQFAAYTVRLLARWDIENRPLPDKSGREAATSRVCRSTVVFDDVRHAKLAVYTLISLVHGTAGVTLKYFPMKNASKER